jgi:hypothetical protein
VTFCIGHLTHLDHRGESWIRFTTVFSETLAPAWSIEQHFIVFVFNASHPAAAVVCVC